MSIHVNALYKILEDFGEDFGEVCLEYHHLMALSLPGLYSNINTLESVNGKPLSGNHNECR